MAKKTAKDRAFHALDLIKTQGLTHKEASKVAGVSAMTIYKYKKIRALRRKPPILNIDLNDMVPPQPRTERVRVAVFTLSVSKLADFLSGADL